MSNSKPLDFSQMSDDAFIRKNQLIPNVIPISSSNFWAKVKAKKFPQPVRDGGCTYFNVGEIRAWMKNPNQEYA